MDQKALGVSELHINLDGVACFAGRWGFATFGADKVEGITKGFFKLAEVFAEKEYLVLLVAYLGHILRPAQHLLALGYAEVHFVLAVSLYVDVINALPCLYCSREKNLGFATVCGLWFVVCCHFLC